MNRAQAFAYRRKIEAAAAAQSDEDALESIELFPRWKAGIDVTVGERYRHDGTLYRCNQSHRTQADWTPDATPALWTVVSLEDWPEWVAPTGAHDAYSAGAHVAHNGRHWESLIDGNIWEPGAVGTEALWKEI